MTYDELAEKVSKMTSDTFQADMVELLKEIKEDYTTRDTLATVVKENEERIRTLQDTNARLFLGQTSKPDANEEEEEEPKPFDLGEALAKIESEES